jgi:hypothetical protein
VDLIAAVAGFIADLEPFCSPLNVAKAIRAFETLIELLQARRGSRGLHLIYTSFTPHLHRVLGRSCWFWATSGTAWRSRCFGCATRW